MSPASLVAVLGVLVVLVGGRPSGGLPARLAEPLLADSDGCGSSETCTSSGHFMLLQRAASGGKEALPPSRKVADGNQAGGARVRAVFVAGLEGAGHHLMLNITQRLVEAFPIKRIGSGTDEAHRGVWPCALRFPLQPGQLIPGIGCHSVEYDAEHFVQLRKVLGELDPQYVHLLPVMFSYPHCGVSRSPAMGHVARRDFMHAHLGFFDEAAEAEDVDIHVIFLYRPISECLVAGCVHRTFEDCEAYAETLASNAGILLRQLEHMKAGRVHCSRFGDVESMVSGIDGACGPQVQSSAAVREVWHPSSASVGDPAARELQGRLSDEATRQIQRADDALRELCTQHSETALPPS